uniref:FHA domain-containing protein n=1 Tax=Nelumbo nucifera TaxID=4432 RepID=A0A822YQS9_NELNU|nr:TPA_asm: hypothetical protein HUJ06_010419 [Nelumbo nucifera]
MRNLLVFCSILINVFMKCCHLTSCLWCLSVLQFNKDGDAYLYDIGSTHGTFVNKQQVKKKEYMGLHVGDVIRFGHSSRLYIFQGPSELMPPENDLANIRYAKIREEMQDREASLLRARQQATLAEGISWGMAEDAVEEDEEDADEVTWQTYKGQLTEKQEKTRDKIIKRTEKVANMKREIDSIRAKDIAQGGLTQGQQTQIARNEQRISQIMEEIESLEETLNESIQESIGARAGKVIRGKKGVTEEEDEVLSDDDEFYDRTKKKKPASLKTGDHQSIETADTLLAKKEAIINEMEEKKKLLLTEKSKVAPEMEGGNDDGDALDAYMTGLSSQLVLGRTVQIQDELSTLQSELDRILYLLKIADPTGEAARKRVQVSKSSQQDRPTSGVTKQLPAEQKKISTSTKPRNGSTIKEGTENATIQASKQQEADQNVNEATESKPPIYTVSKPQWLGATQDMEIKEIKHDEVPVSVNELDQFVDYKDRKKALGTVDETQEKESGIESAAPGLIIRKRKQVEKSEETNEAKQSMYSSTGAETTAADAVALLLKHKRGYYALEGEERTESQDTKGGMESRKDNARPRRVLGPERPAFLNSSPDYESWMPPEGQSGDGRTSLNDRYGY